MSTGSDHTVKFWETVNGTLRYSRQVYEGAILSMEISADGQYAATCALDATLILWEMARGVAIRRYRGHTGNVADITLTPDGKRFISVGDRSIRMWHIDQSAEALLNWVRANRYIPVLTAAEREQYGILD